MVFEFNLLIVEDDATETKSWESLLDIENAKSEKIKFKPKFTESFDEAQKLLEEFDFNAAIVDLNLKQAGGASAPNEDGNMIIKQILDSEIAVVVAFTGEPGKINIPEWATPIVKITRKGGDDKEGKEGVLEHLVSNIEMLQAMSLSQKSFKSEMAKLFSRSIWPRWKNWVAPGNDTYNSALDRHIASHIHATLLENQNQKAHPEEWYFVPPIRNGLRTGDLILFKNEYWIITTPRCDLANDKVDFVHLALCRNVSIEWTQCTEEFNNAKANLENNTDDTRKASLEKKVNSTHEAIRKFTQHRDNKASVHFLPELKLTNGISIGPFCVEFPNICVVKKSDIETITSLGDNRVASLTTEFLPSLVERFGAYFSRIGTPDYSHPDS